MHGQVVQALQGQRQHYQPIRSQLTDSHQLLDVVAAILQVYAFDCVYIADLNAITADATMPNHQTLIAEAIRIFPNIHWWVDAGFRDEKVMLPWLALGVTPIIASESLPDFASYQRLRALAPNSILSLDYFEDGFRGPTELLHDTTQWTQPTIVMSLTKVGTNQGPDIQQIKTIRQQSQRPHLYAAGGVRNQEDIQALEKTGAQGALIASALHQGKFLPE